MTDSLLTLVKSLAMAATTALFKTGNIHPNEIGISKLAVSAGRLDASLL